MLDSAGLETGIFHRGTTTIQLSTFEDKDDNLAPETTGWSTSRGVITVEPARKPVAQLGYSLVISPVRVPTRDLIRPMDSGLAANVSAVVLLITESFENL